MRSTTPEVDPRSTVRRLLAITALVVLSPWLLIVVQPFTNVERLTGARKVKTLSDDAVILDDGTRVALPMIRRIPADDPIFLAAIENGVEVADDGAYGLLTVYPSCGMTAYRYSMLRVNLSDLAGAVRPSCLDELAVGRGEIEWLEEACYRPPAGARVRDSFLGSIRRVRDLRACIEAGVSGEDRH